jgi:predicted enzyme related to lactoylglutathione lyase
MSPSQVVHLEQHTHDLEAANAFYRDFPQWRAEQIDSPWGSYHALLLGGRLNGGIVACGTRRAGCLPYVDVDRIERASDRARRLSHVVFERAISAVYA